LDTGVVVRAAVCFGLRCGSVAGRVGGGCCAYCWTLTNAEVELNDTEAKLNDTDAKLNDAHIKLNETEEKLEATRKVVEKLDTRMFI